MSIYEGALYDGASTSSFSGSSGLTGATSMSTRSSGNFKTDYVKMRKWAGLLDLKSTICAVSKKLEWEGRGNNFISFRGVNTESFKTIEGQRDDGVLGCNARFDYDPVSKELLIRLPTHQHESGHLELAFKVDRATIQMSCDNELNRSGATKRTGARSQSSKEGDSSWTPAARTRKGIKLPSVVIESGFSESLPQLRSDAAKWIDIGEGMVKIVLIISVQGSCGEILIKKWIPVQHVATRSGATLTPTNIQSLTITMRKQRPIPALKGEYVHLTGPILKGHFYVQGAPLLIEFRSLFDRDPNPRNPEERDIQIKADALADFCWRVFSEATLPS